MIPLGKLFRTTVFKVSLAYLAISAIGAGLVLGSVGGNIKILIDEQIAQTIDADISGLYEQFAQGGMSRLLVSIEKRSRRPGAQLYLVTNPEEEPIAGNVTGLPVGVMSRTGITETIYQPTDGSTERHWALARIFPLPGGYRLLVGHDLQEGETLRKILGGALLTSLFWLVVIGTLGGLWVSRRVLNRVDAINANARTIVAGDLSGRLPLAGTGDELDRLVQNLNAMLERISELMAGLKEVSDNIAHDLKTPLTRLRVAAEQALRLGKTPEDYRSALEKVLDESDRLIQIFDALLKIARAEAGAGREGMVDFNASAVTLDVGELYEPLAEEKGIVLRTTSEPNLCLRGSRELVGQAVANLVDNALKYGAVDNVADRTVYLQAARRCGNVEISVADRGPGIAEKDRTRVLDRFVRLENARSRPGSGLGLSLVAAVARLHNGTVRIEDNNPGLRVVLSIPLASMPMPAPAPLALAG
ncbi:sensor histidine kinase [Methylocapsa palsarum]|uniref:histidine kinase n=1 Tax=Methylocapsa palsarum TaxID=1612308 RepID=A0A1I3ZMU4_9HYPH|nr:ATP-binding protein [Methylocapsa palsarum]SFK44869.1 Signal transduction histidine kinase [Methylocapsa palsarum]